MFLLLRTLVTALIKLDLSFFCETLSKSSIVRDLLSSHNACNVFIAERISPFALLDNSFKALGSASIPSFLQIFLRPTFIDVLLTLPIFITWVFFLIVVSLLE